MRTDVTLEYHIKLRLDYWSERSRVMHMKNRHCGFTLVEIMIVVAIIGILGAIAIPNFVRARAKSQQNTCISTLRQIDGAVQQWALENRKAPTDTVNPDGSDIVGFLGRAVSLPVCPNDSANGWATSYSLTTVARPPTCLIGSTLVTPHTLQ
jgi:prepilin-type N-terminal cleavage/methylation domain-containing protein